MPIGNVDDPMWMIGIVITYGEVEGRQVETGVTHTREERCRGRPWRWNIWLQEFQPVVWAGNMATIHREDVPTVLEYLNVLGLVEQETIEQFQRVARAREMRGEVTR